MSKQLFVSNSGNSKNRCGNILYVKLTHFGTQSPHAGAWKDPRKRDQLQDLDDVSLAMVSVWPWFPKQELGTMISRDITYEVLYV